MHLRTLTWVPVAGPVWDSSLSPYPLKLPKDRHRIVNLENKSEPKKGPCRSWYASLTNFLG